MLPTESSAPIPIGGDSPSGHIRAAERVYEQLKRKLEKNYFGQHIVIQATTGRYVVAPGPSAAIKLAEVEFGSTDYCWSRLVGEL